MDIVELAARAAEFRDRLRAAKLEIGAADFAWYPYDSFGVFPILERLLTRQRRDLLALAAGAPLLDVGCGDGDLAFFFESLGLPVTAIDHIATNYNQMRGLAELKAALRSAVEVLPLDLDGAFSLPATTYGLALFLGVLYHLKNPYYALESLARSCRYCLLSTRIASFTAGGRLRIAEEPLAYLVDRLETNRDATNYWVFSEAGLRRILDRTRWEILDYVAVGAPAATSDPVTAEGDQRAYCLLQSRICHQKTVWLLHGWHELERNSYRWTERRFSVRLTIPPAPDDACLKLSFFLPPGVSSQLGTVKLSATVNGVPLPAVPYHSPGEHVYVQRIPPGTLAGHEAVVEFSLDRALPAARADQRELGLIISFLKPGLDAQDSFLPLEIL